MSFKHEFVKKNSDFLSVATNFAFHLAKSGKKVLLLNLAFSTYPNNIFFFKRNKWITDYLFDTEKLLDYHECLTDISSQYKLPGKLFIGFSNPNIEAIEIAVKGLIQPGEILKRLFHLFIDIEHNPLYLIDYFIIDNDIWNGNLLILNSIIVTDFLWFIVRMNKIAILRIENIIYNNRKYLRNSSGLGVRDASADETKIEEIEMLADTVLTKKNGVQKFLSIAQSSEINNILERYLDLNQDNNYPDSSISDNNTKKNILFPPKIFNLRIATTIDNFFKQWKDFLKFLGKENNFSLTKIKTKDKIEWNGGNITIRSKTLEKDPKIRIFSKYRIIMNNFPFLITNNNVLTYSTDLIFTITLPREYPARVDRILVNFETIPWHPYVNPLTGDLRNYFFGGELDSVLWDVLHLLLFEEERILPTKSVFELKKFSINRPALKWYLTNDPQELFDRNLEKLKNYL